MLRFFFALLLQVCALVAPITQARVYVIIGQLGGTSDIENQTELDEGYTHVNIPIAEWACEMEFGFSSCDETFVEQIQVCEIETKSGKKQLHWRNKGFNATQINKTDTALFEKFRSCLKENPHNASNTTASHVAVGHITTKEGRTAKSFEENATKTLSISKLCDPADGDLRLINIIEYSKKYDDTVEEVLHWAQKWRDEGWFLSALKKDDGSVTHSPSENTTLPNKTRTNRMFENKITIRTMLDDLWEIADRAFLVVTSDVNPMDVWNLHGLARINKSAIVVFSHIEEARDTWSADTWTTTAIKGWNFDGWHSDVQPLSFGGLTKDTPLQDISSTLDRGLQILKLVPGIMYRCVGRFKASYDVDASVVIDSGTCASLPNVYREDVNEEYGYLFAKLLPTSSGECACAAGSSFKIKVTKVASYSYRDVNSDMPCYTVEWSRECDFEIMYVDNSVLRYLSSIQDRPAQLRHNAQYINISAAQTTIGDFMGATVDSYTY